MTGKIPEQLQNKPDFPQSCSYVWFYFIRLNSRRGSNGFGPSALSFSEIKAFCELEGIHLESWELEAILRLDDLMMKNYAVSSEKKQKAQQNKSKTKSKPSTVGRSR